jgi:hypothetical protein
MARGRVVERRFVQPVEEASSAEARAPSRGGPLAQPTVSPVTAYAPVRDPSRAITTGRGLY